MIKKIDNNWKFIGNYKKTYLKTIPTDAIDVMLPHNVKDLPHAYFSEKEYQFVSTYFKTIKIDEATKDNKYFLKFDGVMLKAHVYFNNHDYGEFISGYLPFSVDVTKDIKKGENKLIVVVDSREDKLIPPFGFVVDYLTFGGIYRDVFLETKPNNYIEDIYVHGSINGNITISPTLSTNSKEESLSYELYFNDKLVKKFKENKIKINNPKLWDTNTPNLYTLKTTLTIDGKSDVVTRKFGFRDAIFKEDGFYLNNKKIKLIGLNRHQAYPYVGYAMPKNAQEDDANILKNEIGVNAVRCSHYPPSDYFLNKCDEIGLLVIDEVPGWQHIGKEDEWRNNFYDFIKRMVLKDRKFTSIILYGIRIDESPDDHELYSKANQIAHEFDEFRQTTGVRNFKHSECLEDVYAFNDFSGDRLSHGLDNPKTVHKDHKPYLVTEFMGHIKPTKNYDTEEYRITTALRFAKIIDDTYRYPNISGSFGWCAFDYNTHKDFGSGDHICHHGVYDMYRNAKLTSAIYKSQNESKPYLEVLGNKNIGDYCAAVGGKIYVATNLDYLDFYINDELVNRFYPDKNDYAYMPHPLIMVDDLLGNRMKEKFSKKDTKRINEVFNYIAFNGYGNLPLKCVLKVGLVLLHTHKKVQDFFDLYTKYMQNWGNESSGYTFKGYKNGKLAITKSLSPSTSFHLTYELVNPTVELEDSYDVARISIKYLDQNDSIMNYAFMPLELETNKNLEIIGPHLISLIGGQISFYVKCLKVGDGIIKIKSEKEIKTLKIHIK